ncbi:MAG: nucleoside kinase [Clostridiales bacterium]|nr:nucleoside kinase [Clostridiales bacterium]
MAKVSEFKLQHKMSKSFLGVQTPEDLKRVIDEGNFRELVQISEAYQDKRIVEIAQQIYDGKHRVVLIAGPSSSGKTTTAKKLCTQLKVLGLDPLYMGTDDYFVEREQTPLDENGKYNFEDLDAVDVELFNDNIIGLLKGREVDLPTFNFMTGHKEYGKRITSIKRSQIIVIEGIHALNDELTPHIRQHQKFKIFVCPVTALKVSKESGVDPMDHRMLRRMVRDYQFRGHSAKATIDNWPSVRKGEEKNIFPFKDSADVAFNTSHIYEIPILKRHAEPLLKSIKADEPEFEVASKMLKFLEEFPVYDDDSVVPNDSIIREFIGGSTFAAEDPETGKKTFVGGNWFWRNLQNYFKDKHEELKEKREEFAEKHEDTKKELMEIHEELIDNLEEAAKDDVESVIRGEGETVVK